MTKKYSKRSQTAIETLFSWAERQRWQAQPLCVRTLARRKGWPPETARTIADLAGWNVGEGR